MAGEPLLFVIGLPSGGTSCLAGTLERLGFGMGRMHEIDLKNRPFGAFECLDLIHLLNRYVNFGPAITAPSTEIGPVVDYLRVYLRDRTAQPGLQAVKYPTVQVLLSHKLALELPFRLLAVDRPWDDCLTSWTRRRLKAPVADLGRFFGLLAGHREVLFRNRRPLLRVPYYAMLDDPAFWVDKLIEVLGLSPTDKQRARAVRLIRPTRRHIYPSNAHTASLSGARSD